MESVSEKTIDKYRHINVDGIDWWEYTYNEFTESMEQVGIDVDRMFFSGFWSQGDGACFEGRIGDTKLFLDKHFTPTDYPMIRKLLGSGGAITFRCKHSGHYYHENCTSFDVDCDLFAYVMDKPTDFHEQVVERMDEQLDLEMDDFEKASVEIFKNHMRTLYRTLEKEYDYLVGDEAVTETIIANDLNETDEGE
jgi:hypothetical protein